MAHWTFLTNHAHVLMCVARNANFRLRDIAAAVGITERATHRIVTDLVEAGYLTRHRSGRRNYYEINPNLPLRHPLDSDHQIGEIIRVLREPPPGAEQATPAEPTPAEVPRVEPTAAQARSREAAPS